MPLQKISPIGAAGNYLLGEDAHGVQGAVAPGNWKLFYTDGDGDGLKELALGANDLALVAKGAAVAPAWEAKAKVIASGAQALGVAEIADGACAALITTVAAGVLTTDVIDWCFNATPVGKTGYAQSAAALTVTVFPTAGNINVLVCNKTGAAVTPSAMSINWQVVR